VVAALLIIFWAAVPIPAVQALSALMLVPAVAPVVVPEAVIPAVLVRAAGLPLAMLHAPVQVAGPADTSTLKQEQNRGVAVMGGVELPTGLARTAVLPAEAEGEAPTSVVEVALQAVQGPRARAPSRFIRIDSADRFIGN
jgi:hypothetical protein